MPSDQRVQTRTVMDGPPPLQRILMPNQMNPGDHGVQGAKEKARGGDLGEKAKDGGIGMIPPADQIGMIRPKDQIGDQIGMDLKREIGTMAKVDGMDRQIVGIILKMVAVEKEKVGEKDVEKVDITKIPARTMTIGEEIGKTVGSSSKMPKVRKPPPGGRVEGPGLFRG